MEELNEIVNEAEKQNENVNANTNPTTPAMEENPTPAVEETPVTPKSCETVTDEPLSTTQDAPAASELPLAGENASSEAATEAQEEPALPEEPVVDYSAYTREELLEALNNLSEEEVQNIKDRVAQIRSHFTTLQKEADHQAFEAFLAEGGNKEDYQAAADPVNEAFHKAYDNYRSRMKKYQEAQEALKQKNLEAKQQILEELRTLIDKEDEPLKKTYDDFNAIQEKWKAIGEIPREHINDLWQNYHFLLEQFFNKVKINKELRDLDMKRNLEQKIQLCEKAEELIMEPSITKAFKALQDLRGQWREIGPVPTEQNEEIWQRFCAAANQVDERRKEYYEQRKEEFDKNLLAKQALIDKADELTEKKPESAKEWNDVTAHLDELLKVWKTIGPVAREVNEEIWVKFKGKIDQFYSAKKEFFGAIRDEQSENYNKKIDLCLKAEAIAKREDWKKATEELLQLQKEWKEIGAVSRKVSDKIWHRFRGACDEFFEKKNAFFENIRGSEQENLAKKEAIIAQLKEFQFGDSKEENLRVIKDFQRQWMEIGFVPIKEKERLQKEFRAVIDDHFEKLKISAREAEETAYRERIRNVAAKAGNFITSEKQELMDKIEKLRSDINLWDNNLGFFSNSKQADLLKEEFEKKIQGARQEIALLQAKLRILREQEKQEKQEESEKENQ